MICRSCEVGERDGGTWPQTSPVDNPRTDRCIGRVRRHARKGNPFRMQLGGSRPANQADGKSRCGTPTFHEPLLAMVAERGRR